MLLEVENLDAGYGDLQVLQSVDMTIADGEYVSVVGPNGAGKSTVMKSIFGLTTHFGGAIRFRGNDIAGLDPEEVISYGLAYVPQRNNVFPSLTTVENFRMGAYTLDGDIDAAVEMAFEYFPAIADRRSEKAGNLSGGQQQMVAMGRALVLGPDLLLLDEPSAGLAPDLVDEMFDHIDEINEAGTAILVVEQNATEALRRCDRGYVIVQGENRFVDTGQELLDDEQVRSEFLGG